MSRFAYKQHQFEIENPKEMLITSNWRTSELVQNVKIHLRVIWSYRKM